MAAVSIPAAADQEPDPAAVDAARVDFAEGQGHFRSKRWAEALKAFERSYAQVASPNAQLMIGRCLRELGRMPEAATAFSSAEMEARRRVKNGESKYSETAEAALAEGSAVRANLGTMKIHVARSSGATLTVDKKTVALSTNGDATVLHEPGSVQVTVRGADGVEQRQTATVVANNTSEMEFVVADSKSAPPLATKPVPPPDEPAPDAKRFPGWFLPAMLASGALTLGGAGMGFGFGAASKSQFEDLVNKCGPDHCTTAQERAQADTGKRNQTIANVGFGVAIVGVVATGVILFLGLTSDHRTGKL
jgi:hypothetical protein